MASRVSSCGVGGTPVWLVPSSTMGGGSKGQVSKALAVPKVHSGASIVSLEKTAQAVCVDGVWAHVGGPGGHSEV